MEILYMILELFVLIVVAGCFGILGAFAWKKSEMAHDFLFGKVMPILSIISWILCICSIIAIPAVIYITIGKAILGILH